MSKKHLDERVCSNCAAPDKQDGTILKPCGRCRLVFYCNKGCQSQHWKATHRTACVALEDRKPEVVARAEEAPLSTIDCLTDVTCSFCLAKISRATMSTLPCEHSFHETCLASDKSRQCILCMKPYKSVQDIFKTKEAFHVMKRLVQQMNDDDDAAIARMKHYSSELVDAVNMGSFTAALEFVEVFRTSPLKDHAIESVAFRVFERDTAFQLTGLALKFLQRQRYTGKFEPAFYRNCLERLVECLPSKTMDAILSDFFNDDSEISIQCARDLLEAVLMTKAYLNERYFVVHADAIHEQAHLMTKRGDPEALKTFASAADRYELCLKRLTLSRNDKIELLEGLCITLEASHQTKRAKLYARKLIELDSTNEIAKSLF